MSLRNTEYTYGSISKFLHWLMFILVVGLLIVGLIMTEMEKGALKSNVYFLHKSTGLLVLALIFIRALWTLANTKPLLPAQTKPWERWAERWTHRFLYLLLFIMPISGWVMSTAADHVPSFYGLFNLPSPLTPISKPLAKAMGEIHEIFAWVLIAILVLHVAAALKHHFWDKDNVLKRMMPTRKR